MLVLNSQIKAVGSINRICAALAEPNALNVLKGLCVAAGAGLLLAGRKVSSPAAAAVHKRPGCVFQNMGLEPNQHFL